MNLEETTVKVNEIYDGRIIKLHVDDAKTCDGKPCKREVVEHPGGVCVAALTSENELLFVKQYRYPYHEVCLELPAGKLEPGEEPLAAIKRELREETGCTGKDWKFCGNMYPSPGYTSEIIRLWTCRVDRELGELDLDEDEAIEVEKIPLGEALRMVMANEIPDGKTQILVLKAAEFFDRNQLPVLD